MSKTFWLEQRYVFPVQAEDFKEAEEIAFKLRKLIANECGPIETKIHKHWRFWEREGWGDCKPYSKV